MGHPENLPKRQPSNARLKLGHNMVQSCPTPNTFRKKYLPVSKALKNSLINKNSRHNQSGKFKRNNILTIIIYLEQLFTSSNKFQFNFEI